VTFTDHADLTTLVVSEAAAEYIRAVGGQVDGNLYRPPPLDVDGYLDCVQRCRAEFAGQGEYRNADFEGEYRVALRALASSGRAMEVNTSGWLALDATLLTWWREEGGQAVSFGSDAHDPFTIGHQFAAAAGFAEAAGFGPDRDGRGLWVRNLVRRLAERSPGTGSAPTNAAIPAARYNPASRGEMRLYARIERTSARLKR
jgi:hypothetical protein